ncbi:MAG: EamA family transporter [Deltaproteobacteria bacterium]|nr:EamA family transporter [Deltaproteobacteria bacterium]
MSWFFLSILAAFSLATSDALTKRFFSHLSAYEMGLIRLTYTLPWLLGAIFFIPWSRPDKVFFICLSVGLPLEALAFYCYMKALKVSPLSLSLPFLAFTPIFIILTGWLLLGETTSYAGFFGIVLIVMGSYFLNLSRITRGYLEPFKAIFKERGSRLILLVSFIYSITSTLGKLAILHSNPYFFGVIYFTTFTLLMVSFLPVVPGAKPGNLIKMPLPGLILGATVALMIFSHMLAISMVQAAYMISIKRTSLIFGVLYGAWWFKEEKIKERLTGAFIMIVGVFLIGCFG